MAPEELRRQIAVLFQSPVHYFDTAHENMRFGDLSAGREDIVGAGERAGAEGIIQPLPAGYDTALGRWFGCGVELSAGEWRRLALARALIREASIILLDEPTSAMDSWAESDWLERLRSLARGKTVVIITHRLTTAMAADLIHVVEEGRVVESGTHAPLQSQGGAYARCCRAQECAPGSGTCAT
jgi:ATP-binding cassette, subfamily B, bacterial